MLHTFSYNGNIYSYIPMNELTEGDIPEAHPYNNGKVGYMGIECAFDIETSRITEDFSTMYLWGFALGNLTIIGRTWEEFEQLQEMVCNKYQLKENNIKLLCWIHNAPFEFAFMKHRLKYGKNKYGKTDCFLIGDRQPIFFCTDRGIEFRDSYILTRRPLKDLPEVYHIPGIHKLVGEVDYTIIRHSDTPIDEEHEVNLLAYQINDVQILAKWHKKYIVNEFFRKNIHLPLTSTGIVRDELKRNFKAMPKEEREYWKKRIKKCFPSRKMYEVMMEWLFRGGYVHANIEIVDALLSLLEGWDLGSDDIKSSYPAVLLQEGFPYRFVEKPSYWFTEHWGDEKYLKNFAFWMVVTFKHIQSTTSHHIESENKIYGYHNAAFDNGRLIGTDKDGWVTVCLTDFDFRSYEKFYTWDSMEILNLYVADREPLPNYVKDLILKYFYLKETLEKDTMDYTLGKANLNAIYGMMCTRILNTLLTLDDNGNVMDDGERPYASLVSSQILLPQWAIWCTAAARYRLLSAVWKCSQNENMSVAYCDTDSIKNTKSTSNRWIFDTFNDRIKRINRSMYTGKYDSRYFEKLGCFEFESKSYFFKTQGCKRYIHTDIAYDKKSGKYHLKEVVTISGMVKGTLQKYCKEKGLNIYEEFKDGLDLSEEYSQKLGSNYKDVPQARIVVDYLGNIRECEELSCVTLNEITFGMAIKAAFLELIKEQKELNRRGVGNRRW